MTGIIKMATPLRGMLVLMLLGFGCSGSSQVELQRVRSGTLDIVLLSPDEALQHGRDSFILEFRQAANGELVEAGEVRATAMMPMAGTPMIGSVKIARTDVAGRYTAETSLEMAGTWRLSVAWAGVSGEGSVSLSQAVR
jgi:hypothetical protein